MLVGPLNMTAYLTFILSYLRTLSIQQSYLLSKRDKICQYLLSLIELYLTAEQFSNFWGVVLSLLLACQVDAKCRPFPFYIWQPLKKRGCAQDQILPVPSSLVVCWRYWDSSCRRWSYHQVYFLRSWNPSRCGLCFYLLSAAVTNLDPISAATYLQVGIYVHYFLLLYLLQIKLWCCHFWDVFVRLPTRWLSLSDIDRVFGLLHSVLKETRWSPLLLD